MGQERRILTVTVLAGVALIFSQGCSSKAFKAMVGSESMETSAEVAENETGQRDPHSGYAQDGTWEVSQLPNGGYQQDGVWDVAQGKWVYPKSTEQHVQQNPGAFPSITDDTKKFEESMALLPDYGTGSDQSGEFEEGGPIAEEFVPETTVAEAVPSFDFGPSTPESYGEQVDSGANQDYSPGMEASPGGFGQYQEFDQTGGPQGGPQNQEYEGGMPVQVELQDVFFEFDSWRVSQEGAQALVHDATWLAENNARGVTVEGHCDQRGTGDYNMALGQKRAEAVRTYLLDLGVNSEQIQVVSYGKERPFCFGSDDQCMQLNRRGHLKPSPELNFRFR